jgi:hypothetical protein
MPVKPLPPSPSLAHLKSQAKDLLTAHAARDTQAAARIVEFHPRFAKSNDDAALFDAVFQLSDAQLTIARERGFESWPKLKRRVGKPTAADNLSLPHHERIEDPQFREAVDLLDAADIEGLRALLREHPDLVHRHVTFEGGNYFRNPTLLEFAAENPIRRGTLKPAVVEAARVILDAGAKENQAALNETLGLVCSGRIPRECHVQIPLIDMLFEYGADPATAIYAALTHGEFEAAKALIRQGASVTAPVAAALGRIDDFSARLPTAAPEERHRALALASQFGRTEIVRLLLDAGEDPNRYNPPGLHSHSTPLHQAALAGHQDTVRLLVERGTRLDMKDTLWNGTPADWATHEGHPDIAALLLQP